MKKILGIVVLLCVASAGAAVLYLNRTGTGSIAPAELLPKETLVMIEAVDLKESLDEFMAGPLGKAVSGIDMPACMGAFDADPEEIERVSRLQAGLKAAVDSPWFDTLAGDLAVLAVLKSDPADQGALTEKTWRESALIIVQPKNPAGMIQSVGKMFARGVTVTTQDTGGIRMERIETDDGQTLFAAAYRGLGLVALDPKPIVRCLASRESDRNNSSSLANSPDYAALRKDLNPQGAARFFVWIDLHTILNGWFDSADSSDTENVALSPPYGGWDGLRQARPIIGAVMTDEDNVIHHRWQVRYNGQDLPSDLVRMLSASPEKNKTLSWIPETTLYYSWQNNFGQSLKSLVESSGTDAEKSLEFKRAFAAVTGVEVEEAVNIFGSQFAVLVRDIETGGLFPVPELALMAELREPDGIDQIIETTVRNFGLKMTEEEYADVRIRYVPLPYGEDVSPCYARREGFLFIASGRSVMKSLLSRENGHQSLVDTPLFHSIETGLSGPGNQVAYIQPGIAAARAKDLLKWGLSVAVMTGKADEARQMVYLSNKVVEPILEGLSMYPAMGSKTIFQKNQIDSDIYISKPRQE